MGYGGFAMRLGKLRRKKGGKKHSTNCNIPQSSRFPKGAAGKAFSKGVCSAWQQALATALLQHKNAKKEAASCSTQQSLQRGGRPVRILDPNWVPKLLGVWRGGGGG